MSQFRLKKRLPQDCYAFTVDCEICGVECTDQVIFITEDADEFTSGMYCLPCLAKSKPDWVEVIE